jgi:hypothetical protein
MSGDAELRVTFSPPLYLQRRIWVLDILRREHATEVSHVLDESIEEPIS